MARVSLSSANQYANMSISFYNEYLAIEEDYNKAISSYTEGYEQDCKNFSLLNAKEEKAIAAVVFQAFAIEAYINLLGITVFGEEEFYNKTIDNRVIERLPTLKKLDTICKELPKNYPEAHRQKIVSLFKKRDSLVHQKPRKYEVSVLPFDYDHPEDSYKDYLKMWEPFEYLFSNLEEEMALYKEFQENIRLARGAEKELIEEIVEKEIADNQKAVFEAVQSLLDTKSDGETL